MMYLLWMMAVASADERVPDWVTALEDELDRNTEALRLDEHEGPYHLRYKIQDLHVVSALSSFGGLVSSNVGVNRTLGVEVRVGSPDWDNTGVGSYKNGMSAMELPDVVTPTAARQVAWLATDEAYKDALEQLTRKTAQVERAPDHPGDYIMSPGVEDITLGAPAATADAEAVTGIVTTATREFLAYPSLTQGVATIAVEEGTRWVLDSEGTRVAMPAYELSLRFMAQARAEDGMRYGAERLVTVGEWTALPGPDDLRRLARETAEEALAAATAAPMVGEYVGPVVMEGQAATELFRWLLLPELVGTPPEGGLDDPSVSETMARTGRRILPQGWEVVDDPGAFPGHPGSYAFDHEGTPAEVVHAVQDGIVRDLLMSRTPRRGMGASNGHGRGGIGSRSSGYPSMVSVMPMRHMSHTRLMKEAKKAAQSYGLDHVIVIRRLTHPATTYLAQRFSFRSAEGLSLPEPLVAERVYLDGRVEQIRGLSFASVDRRLLRDIMMAGPVVERDLILGFDLRVPWLGPLDGIPSRMRVPEVLVGEMELLPAVGGKKSPPRLVAVERADEDPEDREVVP